VATAHVAPGQKKTARLNAHFAFLDEAGFQLLPSVHRTWAPRGQTPVLRHRTRREKRSVISAVTLSPRRRRVGLYYQIHGKNIQQAEIVRFLHHLLRQIRGPIVLLWDNIGPHKGEPLRAVARRHPRLHLVHFPPYAPELNPDEGVWRLSKWQLANGSAPDLDQLLTAVTGVLEDLRRAPARLRACLQHARLPGLPT
jgi:hypothetical protein